MVATGLSTFIGSTLLVLFVGDLPNNSGSSVLHFEASVNTVYSGIVQALMFGWLYAGVVYIWERSGISEYSVLPDNIQGLPYADTFSSVQPTIHNIDLNTLLLGGNRYMGSFPFYTFGLSHSNGPN